MVKLFVDEEDEQVHIDDTAVLKNLHCVHILVLFLQQILEEQLLLGKRHARTLDGDVEHTNFVR